MRAAQFCGIASGAEVLAGLQRGDTERRAEHRNVDVLARPAISYAHQHCSDRVRRVQSRAEIGHGHAALHRRATRLTGDAHDAAHRLHRQIESALAGSRPLLTEGGDRAIHQRGLIALQGFVAEPKPRHDAGAVVLYQNVRVQHQCARALLDLQLA